jgi:hypothetical protein
MCRSCVSRRDSCRCRLLAILATRLGGTTAAPGQTHRIRALLQNVGGLLADKANCARALADGLTKEGKDASHVSILYSDFLLGDRVYEDSEIR